MLTFVQHGKTYTMTCTHTVHSTVGTSGAVGTAMAYAEMAFGTIIQRVLARPLGVT